MKTIPLDWEKNEQEHAQERVATEEAIRTGKKTAWQIQEENSFIPINAKITLDWADYAERLKSAHARNSV